MCGGVIIGNSNLITKSQRLTAGYICRRDTRKVKKTPVTIQDDTDFDADFLGQEFIFDKEDDNMVVVEITDDPETFLCAAANFNFRDGNAVQKKAGTAPRKVNQFRGIRKRPRGKWAADIRDPRKGCCACLGTFSTGEEAARAYDEMAIRICGKKAKLNFPDNLAPPDISTPRPVTHKKTPLRSRLCRRKGVSNGRYEFIPHGPVHQLIQGLGIWICI